MIKDALRTGEGSKGTTELEDFLTFLKKQNQKDGAKMSERDMFSHLSNHLYDVLLAGSDTTRYQSNHASLLVLLIPQSSGYLAASNFLSLNEKPFLHGKASRQDTSGRFRNTVVANRAWSLVVEEALRLHAAVALNLERIVPEVGLSLCGNNNPAGVIVGINALVLHYDQEVFGLDAQENRIERWEETNDSEQQERLKVMERSFFAVGSSDMSARVLH
ncbi:uncharacterized protein RAG0_04282 [Rhynchosporium agropyri]|uniref:Uncharacterized protein n=1 Tax=Rhynchosporium agropyri TaxID=914238 RepID=A0A1E1K817_9HELO|nr:uncharacterized protein RAG0_04282 [Rhynchosporium agropyri]